VDGIARDLRLEDLLPLAFRLDGQETINEHGENGKRGVSTRPRRNAGQPRKRE
jgi:hypothetical protein